MRLRIFLTFFIVGLASHVYAEETKSLLNVSYDPTREFYEEYNALFIKYWKNKTGQDIKILQSHGGSGKQARSVIEGLRADVVTLGIASDIDAISERSGLLPADWEKKLPHHSVPYSSTIVFLVRKGNPHHIKDWDDLIKDDIKVITPNPKTSSGARWNYLAAWGYALRKNNGNEDAARTYITQLFKHVPVLDAGARGSTTTFVKRGIGDVLIAWENEALLTTSKLGKDEFEIVIPSVSILAETPVAVVEENAKRKDTLTEAQAYLEYLYSKEAQELAVKHYYIPSDPEVAAKHTEELTKPTFMLTIDDFNDYHTGGWRAIQQKHFADGAIFDHIYNTK